MEVSGSIVADEKGMVGGGAGVKEERETENPRSTGEFMNRVLLVVIDALSSRHVKIALRGGRLPNLGRLIEKGEIHEESLSIFPSITPPATTSIATGAYPSEHGIPGAFF